MDNRKKEILLHLYGEAPEESNLRDLLRDEDLKKEYQTLSEVKFKLDHRKRERPDPAVVDAVLAQAGGEATTPQMRRGDRPAVVRGGRMRKLLIPALSIAAALVFAFGLGWWAHKPTDRLSSTAESFDSDLPVPPESLHRFVPPGRRFTSPTRTASTSDPRLAWDQPERLDMWHRRIESLEAASDPDGWGSPAVPLEMLPGTQPSGITPAGTRPDNRRQ